MRVVFCIGLGWVLYVYVGYPMLLALAALWWRRRPVLQDDFLPTVSILIAARNEERDIGWKLAETLAWDYPAGRLEVLVGSDASDDGTDAIVEQADASRVRLVRMETRSGKARVLNRLAAAARGEVLFFTDANSHIAPHVLRRMMAHFADGRVGCVTGYSKPVQEIGEAADGVRAYCGLESLVARLEHQLGSVLVCDGAIFAIRRSLFHPLAPELANDLELPVRIGAGGYWVVQERAACVSEHEACSPAQEFARRRRICAQGLIAMWRLRGLLRGMRRWQFFSHKFLRWFTLVPAVLLLISSAALAGESGLFTGLFAAQLLLWTAAFASIASQLLGHPLGRPLSSPGYFLLTVAGAFVGMLDGCSGRTYEIWQTPAYTRGKRIDTI